MFGRKTGFLLCALVLAALGQPAAQAGVLITEIKAVSNGPYRDEDGAWSDWIELFNSGPSAVNLNGWFLTDDRTDLVKWSFPSTELASGGFLVVFASAKDRRVPGQPLHTSFNLKATGEYLALVEPDGLTIVQEFSPAYPAQTSSFSYGFPMNGSTVHIESPGYLIQTPGAPNPSARASLPLALTELMYNPAPATTNVGALAFPYAFIELKNIGSNTLNLEGVSFGSGIGFTFPAYMLGAGERVLVVNNAAAFESRYGTGLPIAGQFTGTLNGSGERLELHGPDQAKIFDFIYDQAWHRITDGHGFSLVPVNENAPASVYGQASTWRPSGQRHGSPGRLDLPSSIPPVYINEVLTRSQPPYEDAIELFNPGTNDVDISGWFLTDNINRPSRFTLPLGAIVPAGGFLAMDEHTFNAENDDPLAEGFGLGDFGEEIYLFSAAANRDLTGFVHGFKFATAEANVTFGRYVLSTGEEVFVPQSAITFLETNSGPKVGPIVITEIHYHPPDLNGSDNKRDEFVELQNISDMPVPLYDVTAPSNTWRLLETELNAMFFSFPTGVVMAAHSRILVTRLGTNDPIALQAFRQSNHMALGTPLFGPWQGSLANSLGRIELMRPDPPELEFIPPFVPFITMDKVQYRDSFPWPLGADGTGSSLQRIVPEAYGNDPTNWRVAFTSAGLEGGAPPVVITQPEDQDVQVGASLQLSIAATGDGPFVYEWRFNGAIMPDATGPTLLFPNIQLSQAGTYGCTIWGAAGVVVSRIASIEVFDAHPPTLQVTWPSAPVVRVISALFTATGRATDDVEVSTVLMQNGSGPFLPVNGTTNWHSSLTLKPGFNTLRFVAIDSYGNVSPTNTSTVLFQPDAARLGLLIRGSGSVSGASNGRQLRSGQNYTFTAIPAPGHLFGSWQDTEGDVISTNRTLTIRMQPYLTLSANFYPGPFLDVNGAYDGLFYAHESPGHTNAGSFNLNVTAGGAYSGRLLSRGKAYALHGQFGSDLSATQIISRPGSNNLSVTMHLGSAGVTGTVSELHFTSQMAGHRAGFSPKSVGTNFVGRYTVTLTNTSSLSNSLCVLSVSSAGRIALHGRLPDRTAVTKELRAGEDGLAPLYFSLYDNRGSAFGWLAFTNPAPDLLQNRLLWTRTGSRGFTNMLELRGRR